MADQRERSEAGTREDTADRGKRQQPPMTDLESPADEAEKVKGGRLRRGSSDPCEGGE